MPRLVITHIDYLVTVDPSRRIIRDGAIAIADGRITAVGKTDEYPALPDDEVIDGRGKLALPGVFDTHVHNAQQLGRSCGDEAYSGPERLFRRLWPIEAHMDKGDALCAARLAQLEMIRAGTTCFAAWSAFSPMRALARMSKSAVVTGVSSPRRKTQPFL